MTYWRYASRGDKRVWVVTIWCMRIDEFNIYDFTESRLVLLSYLEKRKEVEQDFSVRKWSKEMDFNSHTLLNLQLQGKRKVRAQHIERFSNSMGLTSNEVRYFKGITVLEKADTPEEKEFHYLNLQKEIPKTHLKTKKYNQFSIIADWVHMGILSLSEIEGLELTEAEIYRRLGHRLSKVEILQALTRLCEEGLLINEEGTYQVTYQSVMTTNDISDVGIKEYHRQASQLAKEAVDDVALEDREFQSFCMGIASDKMPLAKEMIRKFRDEFYHAVAGNGDNTYKMNIQLFQLSRCPDSQSGVREFAQDKVQ